jgi:hypothetical protein
MSYLILFALIFFFVYPLVSIARNDYYKTPTQKASAFAIVFFTSWFGWLLLWSMRNGKEYFVK